MRFLVREYGRVGWSEKDIGFSLLDACRILDQAIDSVGFHSVFEPTLTRHEFFRPGASLVQHRPINYGGPKITLNPLVEVTVETQDSLAHFVERDSPGMYQERGHKEILRSESGDGGPYKSIGFAVGVAGPDGPIQRGTRLWSYTDSDDSAFLTLNSLELRGLPANYLAWDYLRRLALPQPGDSNETRARRYLVVACVAARLFSGCAYKPWQADVMYTPVPEVQLPLWIKRADEELLHIPRSTWAFTYFAARS
ncbi:MAG: hypothetical protein KDB07_09010, partial [Planctomycetes bacterium]|nr:hypothetical protein [Planctomycetota bacterium]